jgi:hypothetical protein
MKRKQIYIEEDEEARLKELAARRGVAEAVVIREAVASYLAANEFKGFERMEDNPLWGLVGLIDDTTIPTDSSINHDHYIYGTPKKYRIRKDGTVERIRKGKK